MEPERRHSPYHALAPVNTTRSVWGAGKACRSFRMDELFWTRSLQPFALAATTFLLLATEVAAQGTCNLLGEVFVTNPFDQTLTIKGDGSADINTIRFSNQTQFVQVTVERKPAGEFDPKNLQAGDRLCVQFPAAQAKTAGRVLVMKRSEIQEHQKQVFSALARNSAFEEW